VRRRTFDTLVSAGGLVLAVVLLVAGGLAMWGANFANANVVDRLKPQQISFPAASALSDDEKANPEIVKYAGQKVDNGDKARVYADMISIHLKGINNGKTYSQTSAESRANPEDTAMAAKVQTLFRGETLRSILYNAYGWWKVAQVMLIAAWVALIAGLGMLILAVLGFMHGRRTPQSAEL
jgi:hypothetical protein